jgi:hypothetical protein
MIGVPMTVPRAFGVAGWILLVALLLPPAPAQAAASFAPPTVVSTVGATFVAVGQVNGDAHLDVVALDTQTGTSASVLLNDGTGRFSTRIDVALPMVTRWLAIGQFAGDASRDLVLVGDSGEVRVMAGNGAGVFTDTGVVKFAPGVGPFAGAAVGDLDGDGRTDLVVAHGGVASRLLQLAGGGFGDASAFFDIGSLEQAITGVAMADLTGDGRPEVVLHVATPLNSCDGGFTFPFEGTVHVVVNSGTGVTPPASTQAFASGADTLPALALADMNGDGRVDVVTASRDLCNFTRRITALLNNGSTSGAWNGLAAVVSIDDTTFQPDPAAAAVADVDGDGRQDIVTMAVNPNDFEPADWQLKVITRTGGVFASSFVAPVAFPLTLHLADPLPRNVAAADLNGDGRPDVIVPVDVGSGATPVPANFPSSVVVYFNTAPTAPVGGTARLTVTPAGSGAGTVTSSNPSGISCGNGPTACSLLLPAAPPANVILTAAAAAGSTFTGWSGGGCAGTGQCVVALDQNKTVIAFFASSSELGSPEPTDELRPLGLTVSFINAGTPGFNLGVFSIGNTYTETSVVRLNGVNQGTTPLFSGAGSGLQAFIAYAALPSTAGGPTQSTITVLNGLPSGPFSLSTPFPLHGFKPCLTQPDPCSAGVTALPNPANPGDVAFTLYVSSQSELFEFFEFVFVNGQEREIAVDEGTCGFSGRCSAFTVPVLFSDIAAAGTLLVTNSNFNPTQPGVAALTIRPPLQIVAPSPLPGGTQGTAYYEYVTTTGGGPAKQFVLAAGALPSGVTLNFNSIPGLLGGIPTQAGTFNFTVTVSDADFPLATATKSFALTIAPPLAITTTSPLPGGTQGTPYPQVTLAATGGTAPLVWSLSAGALPGGLTLSSAGIISGTPNTAGTFGFTVRVVDAASATDTKSLQITIAAALSVTTASLPGGTVGAVYPTQTLAATGGTAPRTWTVSAGALPNGLTLSAAGEIGGTPTAAGTFNFTARVTDAVGATATKALSIVVAADTAGPTVTIQSPAPPKATVTSTPATVSGTAADNVAVTQVTWANDRGGGGGATGTTAWTASGIPLQPGKNVITITARDAPNNTGTAQIAIYFFQDTLSVGITAIKAVHFLQLATAIENMRTRLGFPGPATFEWTGTAPAGGGAVRASHLNDLRAALGALFDHAGIAVGSTFTRTPIAAGTRIDAAHLTELRTGIRTLP